MSGKVNGQESQEEGSARRDSVKHEYICQKASFV